MKPTLNLTIVVSALLGLTLSLALVVAYYRNYSSMAGGHPHGTPEKMPSGGQGHDDGGHTSGGHDAKPTSGNVPKHPQEKASQEAAGHHENTGDTSAKDHAHKTQSAEGRTRPPSIPRRITTNVSPITRPVSVAKSATLSGIPGASHLYHVGAKRFFLDQQMLIILSPEQRAALHRIQEKALAIKASSKRKMQDDEGELWKATSAIRPNAVAVEQKVRDIENTRYAQRLSFINAVGEATQILTRQQRALILGTGAPVMRTPNPQAPEHKHD